MIRFASGTPRPGSSLGPASPRAPLRLLYGGHEALHLGSLAGYSYADEACQDPILPLLLTEYMVVEDNVRVGRDIDRAGLVLASWFRHLDRMDREGRPPAGRDRLLSELLDGQRGSESPVDYLRNRGLLGGLAMNRWFTDAIEDWVERLASLGARRATQLLLEGGC